MISPPLLYAHHSGRGEKFKNKYLPPTTLRYPEESNNLILDWLGLARPGLYVRTGIN